MPSEAAIPIRCLKCQSKLTSPVICADCHSLYPLPYSADYFDLLALPKSYAIDEQALTAAFRAIARNVHPDRFTAEAGSVRSLATRLAAEVNQAYKVLKDPVQRADYMLELAGGPSGAELRDVPGNLLSEVMMLREDVERARSSGDAAGLDRCRKTITSRRDETLRGIAVQMDQLATSDPEQRKEVRRALNSIRYYQNLLAELAVDPLAPADRSGA